MGHLSTHILDAAQGKPAEDVTIDVHALHAGDAWRLLKQVRTNADGRTDLPVLADEQFERRTYMLTFHIGSYFRRTGLVTTDRPFLDLVPIRFSIKDEASKYHVPLLVTPWAYSTYRGS